MGHQSLREEPPSPATVPSAARGRPARVAGLTAAAPGVTGCRRVHRLAAKLKTHRPAPAAAASPRDESSLGRRSTSAGWRFGLSSGRGGDGPETHARARDRGVRRRRVPGVRARGRGTAARDAAPLPARAWPEMTLEEYAQGQDGHPENLCRWIERQTDQMGSIRGGSARKLIVYKHRIKPGWYFPPEFTTSRRPGPGARGVHRGVRLRRPRALGRDRRDRSPEARRRPADEGAVGLFPRRAAADHLEREPPALSPGRRHADVAADQSVRTSASTGRCCPRCAGTRDWRSVSTKALERLLYTRFSPLRGPARQDRAWRGREPLVGMPRWRLHLRWLGRRRRPAPVRVQGRVPRGIPAGLPTTRRRRSSRRRPTRCGCYSTSRSASGSSRTRGQAESSRSERSRRRAISGTRIASTHRHTVRCRLG